MSRHSSASSDRERAARRGRIGDPAPRLGEIERAFHLVGAAVRELVVSALVAGGEPLPLAEVEGDTARRTMDLIGKVGP